jgi:fibronectin type 3 domain-containing protein
VQVNLDLLLQAAVALQNNPSTTFSITLNLFTDATFSATLNKAAVDRNGVTILSGSTPGLPGSEVSLALKDNTLAGTLNMIDSFYRLRMLDSSQIILEQINLDNQTPSGAPPAPPVTAYNLQSAGLVGDDDGTLLDVMVVYTPSARIGAGSTSAMESAIANAINLSNNSYNNSQINTQMQLVHTTEVNYTESNFAYETNLDHLTYTNDGYMDNIHTLRNTYSADLVVLIRESGSYCGIAWMLQQGTENYFDQYAFAVVSRGCISNYSVAHETGHNLGAHHNFQDASGNGYYNYSYGHIVNGSFRTIMAYLNNNVCTSGCPRINYWSNPNVSYNNQPTGTSSADNARTLNSTRTIAARFRDGPPPTVPTNINGSALSRTSIQVTWTDASNNEAGFRVERAAISSSTWTQIGGTSSNQTSYTDSDLTCGSSYRYRVKSYNGNGTSAASAEKTLSTQSCLAAPTNLTATPLSSTQIRLNWTDTNTTETGYRVERAPQSGSTWSIITTTAANTTTYTDSTAACGTGYQYRVIAVEGASNESTPSSTAAATSGLCAPGSLTATALSQQRIRLTWSDTNSLEEGYRVERSPNGSSWSTLANLAANTTQYEETGLACGSTYYYRVSAFASGLLTSPTTQVTRATNACGAPSTPQGVTARGFTLNSVQLQWTDVLDDETGYRVERSPNGSSGWVSVGTTGQNVTTFVDANLQNGVTYYYRVIATNSYGSSAASSIVSAHPHTKAFYLVGF